MFKNRSYEKELMDDLNLSSDDLRRNLEELELVNKYLGGHQITINGLNQAHKHLKKDRLKILDIGSGGGDTLRMIDKWAGRKNLKVSLTGLDANQFMIDFAKSRCKDIEGIQFIKHNVFEIESLEEEFDIITLNLFCHHFTDEELKRIINGLRNKTKTIIINDLHRNVIAYYSIWALAHIFNASYLFKNDAPLSVKRSFKKNEIESIFSLNGELDIIVKWKWAFRWLICIFTD